MNNEISRSMMFVFIVIVFETVENLAFSVYSTFVLEEKHGFNKQTPMFYIKDQVGYLYDKTLQLTQNSFYYVECRSLPEGGI